MGKAASSLTLYRAGTNDKQRGMDQVKTTMMFRSIANPRRTTLAHLKDVKEIKDVVDAAELPAESEEERPEPRVELPSRTANPKRTVLTEVPGR